MPRKRKKEKIEEDSIEKIIVALHPKFIEIVKKVYPLAVLGSISIATAAFTAQTYPEAQGYAITAASLFLIAFASSFLFMIIGIDFLAFMSYISVALATLFLFLVVIEFGKTVSLVSKSLFLIPVAFGYLLILYTHLRLRKIRKGTRSRLIFLLVAISIFLSVLFTVTGLITTIIILFDISLLPSFILPSFGLVALASLFLSLTSGFISILLVYRERKKKRTEAKARREALI